MVCMEDLAGTGIQSFGANLLRVKVKGRKAIFIKNHALGLLFGRASAVSPGTPLFSGRNSFLKGPCSLLLFDGDVVREALTSIPCMSFHVNQIWLLVQAQDRPGRERHTVDKYIIIMAMNRH